MANRSYSFYAFKVRFSQANYWVVYDKDGKLAYKSKYRPLNLRGGCLWHDGLYRASEVAMQMAEYVKG